MVPPNTHRSSVPLTDEGHGRDGAKGQHVELAVEHAGNGIGEVRRRLEVKRETLFLEESLLLGDDERGDFDILAHDGDLEGLHLVVYRISA